MVRWPSCILVNCSRGDMPSVLLGGELKGQAGESNVSVCMVRWLSWIVALLFVFSTGETVSAGPRPPQSILILNESAMVGPFYAAAYQAMRSRLIANSPQPISMFLEHLELERFGNDRHEKTVRTYLGSKYRDEPIGVVVALGAAALDFVLRAQSELWPNVAVIFVMVDEATLQRLSIPPNVTGLTSRVRFRDLLTSAHAVVPGLQRIAIVGDDWDRQTAFRHFKDEIPEAASGLNIIDLVGLPMREVRSRVALLPERTAIIYTSIFSDGEGTSYPPVDALARIAEVANQPIVIPAETFLGPRGGIGGHVLMPAAVGEGAADLAHRILEGESPSAIPIADGNVVRPIFDWRQLQRWGVKQSQLPAGSEIRFLPPTAWEQHKASIVGIIAVVLAQTALIAWLLYEHRERVRSEVAAHSLSGQLITAHEEERSRLARELHDDLTQRLASLAIEAGRGEAKYSEQTGPSTMRTIKDGLSRLSEDVHALSYRLHPSILADLGLRAALESECEHFSQSCSTVVDLDTHDLPEQLSQEVGLCLFRIAQECLRNIARHASARRVEMRLSPSAGGVQLTVKDNGLGFDTVQKRERPSLGLASMQQRVSLLGGDLKIESKPLKGTTIWVWVPSKAGSA